MNWVTYLGPMVDFHVLSHFVIFCAAGSTIPPSNIFSIEGPFSWTNLTDSESRLSRFSKAITSFRCSCTCKTQKNVYVIESLRKRHIQSLTASTTKVKRALNKNIGIWRQHKWWLSSCYNILASIRQENVPSKDHLTSKKKK